MTLTKSQPTLDEILAQMQEIGKYREVCSRIKEHRIYVKFHTEPEGYFGSLRIRNELDELTRYLRNEYSRIIGEK